MEIMDFLQASCFIGEDTESNPLMDFVIDIQSNMYPLESPECCIYRVPKKLRKVNEEAYTPKLVSIGPFHHGKEELKDMEKLKLAYLKEFLHRTQRPDELLKFIKDEENNIRRCYSEKCELESDDFVKMILLDAIFIIELFRRTKYDERDYILKKPWLVSGIQHDLLLLENQLPFFFLGKLYMFAFSTASTTTFLELSLNYFKSYGKQKPEFNYYKEAKHLRELIRYFFIVPDLKPTKYLNNLYSATKLDDAGLKFKAAENDRRLLEIKLHQNRFLGLFRCFDCSWLLACLPCLKCFPCLERRQCFLEVPQFEIDDNTEAVFRNLMALEQCHYPYDAYICNYVLLLDRLIDTEKDVDLLVDKKVILNNIGSNDAVATLINKLGLQIVETGSCYYDLGQKLNQHYEHPLNRILATLTSVYFRDFWRGTATVVGLIVLFFTFWNFLEPYVK